MNNKELCEYLSEISVSGFESNYKNFLVDKIKRINIEKLDIKTDPLGNLYITKIHDKRFKNLLINSHMDETGFIVGSINSNGTIQMVNQGGFIPYSLINTKVILHKNNKTYNGLIYFKEDAAKSLLELNKIENYFADFGFKNKKDATDNYNIIPGDCISFGTRPKEIINNRLIGKSIDNHVSNYVVISQMNKIIDIAKINKFNVCFSFTCQEELGTRGAHVLTHNFDPDLVINLDCSPTRETTSAKKTIKNYCKIGNGVHIRIYDGTYITKKEVTEFLKNIFDTNKICYQYFLSAGSTDSSPISLSKSGYTIIPLTIGYRYNHGPCQLIDLFDVGEMQKALLFICKGLSNNVFDKLVYHYQIKEK